MAEDILGSKSYKWCPFRNQKCGPWCPLYENGKCLFALFLKKELKKDG